MTAAAARSTGTQEADHTLVQRARTSADVLTGLIATGMLHQAGQPSALPVLLWPDTDPGTVLDIWHAALAVGYWAGSHRSGSRWNTTELDQAVADLREAGYSSMASAVERAAYAAPSRRPEPEPQHTAVPFTADAAREHS